MRHDHAALALDRFEHYRDGLRADDRVLQRGDVVERDQPKAGYQRLETLVVFLLARGGQSRKRPSVKGSERRDDLEAAAAFVAPSPRQLDRRLIGLRAGVAEE